MTLRQNLLAEGPGWHVHDVVCRAGPKDRPFEEVHETIAIALVVEGTFQYRTRQGTAVMVPGAFMLGNHGVCFECGHEHAVGDRCISFHYRPEFWEELVAAVPGARRSTFREARLSPSPWLAPMTAGIDAAGGSDFEAIAMDVAAWVVGADSVLFSASRHVSRLDERRVTETVRAICDSDDDVDADALTLSALGRAVGMSPYHFLRTFRRVVGSTPRQYVIRRRIHQAAARLLTSTAAISEVAYDAGFGDLSTFNRRFKLLFGVTPRQYRHGGRSGFASDRFPLA